MIRAILLLIVALLSGCATGSVLVTGNVRQPIAPEAVKVYLDPPGDFEVIAVVQASSEMGLTQQGSQEYALNYMKEKAAAVGANGLLLTRIGKETGTSSGVFMPTYGGGGFFVGSSDEAISLSAKAIYVRPRQ